MITREEAERHLHILSDLKNMSAKQMEEIVEYIIKERLLEYFQRQIEVAIADHENTYHP